MILFCVAAELPNIGSGTPEYLPFSFPKTPLKTIRIVNPRQGHAEFTSERAARKYVERRKIARWVDENKEAIFFYHDTFVEPDQKAVLAEMQAKSRVLGTVLFWNGDDADPLAIHRPGEVRC